MVSRASKAARARPGIGSGVANEWGVDDLTGCAPAPEQIGTGKQLFCQGGAVLSLFSGRLHSGCYVFTR